MEFNYIPSKLIKAKQEIVEQHANIGEPKILEPNLEIMRLILRLTKLDEKSVYSESLVLTKKELEIIAGYIPHNFYDVKLDNLFQILQIRNSLKLCNILLYEWQNSYDNQECNDFLKLLIKKNEYIGKIISGWNLTACQFIKFLDSENIPVAYGRTAVLLNDTCYTNLNERLEYLGIRSNSKLSNMCNFLFFTFCSRQDYLLIGENELLSFVNKYDENTLKVFLNNFLNKLSLQELKNFKRIAEYFLHLTGENRSEKFNNYFLPFDEVIIRKYVDWINIYKINKIFGTDERSRFWEKYHHELVTNFIYSNSVVMEFENFVAVEFLGQAMGPAYIYRKNYYNVAVRDSFEKRLYDNAGLRSHLLHNTEYVNGARNLNGITGSRLIHNPNPGWQDTFKIVLLNNRITEQIKF